MESVNSQSLLVNTSWVLVEYSSAGQAPVHVNYSDKSGKCYQRLVLNFWDKNKLTSDLNDSLYSSRGSYSIQKAGIKIDLLINTTTTFIDQEKYCGVLPHQRARLALMLNTVTSFSKQEDQLTMTFTTESGKGIMQFKKIPFNVVQ